MGEVVVTIHYDFALLSPNRTKRFTHYTNRKRQNDSKLAAIDAWRRAGSRTLQGPVVMDITFYRGRWMDHANLLAAAKWATDALCNRRITGEGILHDDSPKHLEIGNIKQIVGSKWKGHERAVFRFVQRPQVPEDESGAEAPVQESQPPEPAKAGRLV